MDVIQKPSWKSSMNLDNLPLNPVIYCVKSLAGIMMLIDSGAECLSMIMKPKQVHDREGFCSGFNDICVVVSFW